MLASHDHIDILKSGVRNWNKWREENTTVTPDLKGAILEGANLRGADLAGACLIDANLAGVIENITGALNHPRADES